MGIRARLYPRASRQRFGDADYDWDYRVNTTSGAVGWRDRLLGMFHSAYQPTEPVAFHEMLDAVQQAPGPGQTTLNFRDFTFIDLGSGKGRTLLMASDYPFRRIVGVELLHICMKLRRRICESTKANHRNASLWKRSVPTPLLFRFPKNHW